MRIVFFNLMAAGLVMVSAHGARAAVVVYEPFAYGTGSTLNTISPNASTVGLNQAVVYSGAGADGYTVQAASLSLGSLATQGGSVAFVGGTKVASGTLALQNSPYTGTLYTSHLVNLSARGGGAADGAQVRVANNDTSGGDRFNLQADSRASSTNVAVNYNGSTSGVTNSGNSLVLDTTYLLIGRFTNVGNELTVGNPGVATVYALTAAQFESFKAGGGDDAYLDAATVGTGASDLTARVSDAALVTGTFNFNTGNFYALVAVNDTGAFDEVRYGSTVADVTPVPEPGLTLLALAGLPLLARRRAAGRA